MLNQRLLTLPVGCNPCILYIQTSQNEFIEALFKIINIIFKIYDTIFEFLPQLYHFETFETYNLTFYHLANLVPSRMQAAEQIYMGSDNIFPILFQSLLE